MTKFSLNRSVGAFTCDTSCVLFVDLQERLVPVLHNSAAMVANAHRLASAARILNVPVLATEQNPSGLGETVKVLNGLVTSVFAKSHFDATLEANWSSFIFPSRRDFVVAGSEAHVCVLQTVIGLLRQDASVRIAIDAVGSRTLENKEAGVRRAEAYGAEIVTTEMVLFEWLQSCRHQSFRTLLNMLKH